MKVLLVNGSAKPNGNTFTALTEAAQTLEAEGIETEIFQIGNQPIRGCIACNTCKTRDNGRCVFDDDICNRLSEKAEKADGFIFGSPTYYGQPNGALIAIIQRALYSNSKNFKFKPVANLVICRRGGATTAFQTMNMPFQMLNMPIVTSQYWNIAYGCIEKEVTKDNEGMQTIRTMARNMAWLLKNLDGKEKPALEQWNPTNFIR